MRIILGHMGETLPYMFWRLDSRCSDEPQIEDAAVVLSEEQFFRHQSGQFSDVPLACAISELGEDNVMFSIDYPYKDSKRRGTIH